VLRSRPLSVEHLVRGVPNDNSYTCFLRSSFIRATPVAFRDMIKCLQ
jgi:hypothetical protein